MQNAGCLAFRTGPPWRSFEVFQDGRLALVVWRSVSEGARGVSDGVTLVDRPGEGLRRERFGSLRITVSADPVSPCTFGSIEISVRQGNQAIDRRSGARYLRGYPDAYRHERRRG